MVQTSALTMNIAGVVKDWLLIGLSITLYHSPVSRINLGGYSIAFVAVSAHANLHSKASGAARLVLEGCTGLDWRIWCLERLPVDLRPNT